MLNGTVAKRYAQALHAIAIDNNQLDALEKELQNLGQLIQSVEDLKNLFYHPSIIPVEKKGIVNKIFENQFSRITKNFVNLLIDRRREIYLPEILMEYSRLANITRNKLNVEVETATELTSVQKDRLASQVAKATGKNVDLATKVNPGILGGVVLRIGDKIIDGSIAGKLARLKNQLLEIQVTG